VSKIFLLFGQEFNILGTNYPVIQLPELPKKGEIKKNKNPIHLPILWLCVATLVGQV